MKLYELLPKGSLTSNRQSYDSKFFGKKTFSSLDFSLFDKERINSNDSNEKDNEILTSKKKRLLNEKNNFCLLKPIDDECKINFILKSKNYFNVIVHNKLNRVINNIRSNVNEIIISHLKEIPLYKELIKYLLDNQHKEKASCWVGLLCLFGCKKNPKKLSQRHNMSKNSELIYNEYRSFILNLSEEYSNLKIKEKINPNIEKEERIIKDKINYLFSSTSHKENPLFDAFIGKKIDNFFVYLYIDTILAKQKEKIKAQREKIKEIQEILSDNSCIICMDHQRSIVFMPCMHLICCKKCSLKNVKGECPECKAKIEEMISTN